MLICFLSFSVLLTFSSVFVTSPVVCLWTGLVSYRIVVLSYISVIQLDSHSESYLFPYCYPYPLVHKLHCTVLGLSAWKHWVDRVLINYRIINIILSPINA